MNKVQIKELIYQALETELGGSKVYKTALRCVQNSELKKEWKEYLEQTENHVRIVEEICHRLGFDTDLETPGRQVVRHKGKALIEAMEMALKSGPPAAAELVAAECVVEAETKDHQNWELIGAVAENLSGTTEGKLLQQAFDEVEDEEDEHLYHTTGWARELWIKSLGLPAVVPPPEEEKDVKTAIGAARAKQSRKTLLKK